MDAQVTLYFADKFYKERQLSYQMSLLQMWLQLLFVYFFLFYILTTRMSVSEVAVSTHGKT